MTEFFLVSLVRQFSLETVWAAEIPGSDHNANAPTERGDYKAWARSPIAIRVIRVIRGPIEREHDAPGSPNR